MTVKIPINEFNYLGQQLKAERFDLFKYLTLTREEQDFVFFDLDEDAASDIRDWAGEKLQKYGFDQNYKLTKEGVLLENLIDALYK